MRKISLLLVFFFSCGLQVVSAQQSSTPTSRQAIEWLISHHGSSIIIKQFVRTKWNTGSHFKNQRLHMFWLEAGEGDTIHVTYLDDILGPEGSGLPEDILDAFDNSGGWFVYIEWYSHECKCAVQEGYRQRNLLGSIRPPPNATANSIEEKSWTISRTQAIKFFAKVWGRVHKRKQTNK